MECKHAFQTLKQTLITTLVLTKPDMTKGFDLYFDASKIGLGCALTQGTKVVGYASR